MDSSCHNDAYQAFKGIWTLSILARHGMTTEFFRNMQRKFYEFVQVILATPRLVLEEILEFSSVCCGGPAFQFAHSGNGPAESNDNYSSM